MRCFTLNENKVLRGIPISRTSDGVPCIQVESVGETGEFSSVPLFVGDYGLRFAPERIWHCSIHESARSGRRYVRTLKGGDDAQALVLTQFPLPRTQTGVHWSAVSMIRSPCVLRLTSSAAPGHECCARCGVRFRHGVHPDDGNTFYWPTFPGTGVRVIAERFRHFYIDGPLGDYPERLLVMQPDSVFRVSLLKVDDLAATGGCGEVNFLPAYRRYVRWTGSELQLGSFQEIFPHILMTEWERQFL